MTEKSKKLDSLINKIEKAHGQGSVFLEGKTELPKLEKQLFGIPQVDNALGGGMPYGRIIELFGENASGKTTLLLILAARMQAEGKTVMFVDMEHALNPEWAAKLGVDMSKVLISQPEYAEAALSIVEDAVESEAVDLIILDSVATLVPKKELEGDMGDSSIGVVARLMSQALRKLSPKVNKNKVILGFINQYRTKIGVLFGDPRTTTGGKALEFYASIRIEVAKSEVYKDDNKVSIGNKVKINVKKNKVGIPFKVATFDLDYAIGYDADKGIVQYAVEKGIITRAGAWYSYGETRLGQGMDKVMELIRDNPELLEDIKSKL